MEGVTLKSFKQISRILVRKSDWVMIFLEGSMSISLTMWDGTRFSAGSCDGAMAVIDFLNHVSPFGRGFSLSWEDGRFMHFERVRLPRPRKSAFNILRIPHAFFQSGILKN